MQHNEILRQLPVNPSEIVFAITMRPVLDEIVHRLGQDALALSPEDFALLKEQTQEAIIHNLDERELIDMGVDAWMCVRNL